MLSMLSPPLTAQAREIPRRTSVTRLSSTEELGTIQGLPSRRASGALEVKPPLPPPTDLEENEETQPPLPMAADGFLIAPQQTVETRTGGVNAPQASGTLLLFRDSTLAPSGLTSNVNEPSVASQGDGIFNTHNWYAETSTNNGNSFSFVNPFTLFPASPAAFSAGFCCDQRAAQDSSRNLIFWLLQYIKTGSTSSSTNGVRLAVAHGQTGLAANSWIYYDFTPSLFGLPAGTWLDFPHLQASANYLYFTSNVFTATTDSYYGALVVRIPLSQLDSGASLTFNYLSVVGSYGGIMPVNGAQAEGTRPGRTTMYFAAVNTSTTIKVLVWPESSTSLTINTVSSLASTGFAVYTCPGPDGLDPCTRASSRMQTGWITDTELGFMWNSSQNGASRPFPYVRTVTLNPATLAVLAQPDIFSTSSAWLYPALSVNQRGHLGGTVDFLGGTTFPIVTALIRDDFSPDPTTSGWEVYVVTASNSGAFGRWGDYNGAMPHEKYPTTWLAAGHTQIGGSANGNAVTHNFWFGRERDSPTPSCYTLSRTHTGSGSDPSASPANASGCASGQYHAGDSISLSATPTSGWSVGSWSGTNNNGSTSTSNTATMPASALTVTVNYTQPVVDLPLSNGVALSDSLTGATSQSSWKYYYADLAAGSINLLAFLSSLSADADLYVRFNAKPTLTTYDCRPYIDGTLDETCSFSTPGAGRWWIGVNNFDVGTISYQVKATWSGAQSGVRFYTVTPCRLLDTRSSSARLSGAVYQLQITGSCGVPSSATAIAANVTVVNGTGLGSVAIWPANLAQPIPSAINFAQGQIRANNARLMLSTDGLGNLKYSPLVAGNGSVDLILDVSGYFAP